MTQIITNHLSKLYDKGKATETHALSDINLSISEGEFISLSGPSGSGKTTLLNLIGGLDKPDQGNMTFDGHTYNTLSEKELAHIRLHKIGFIFQAYNLIPVLTALENIEYIMMLQNVAKDIRYDKAFAISKELGIDTLLHKRPADMSGGQQQRVAIARAIVSEPKLILADEPTANLDSKTGSDLIDLMRRLNQEKKITFIFSTHDAMVIEKSTRDLILKDGKIVSDTSN